jgi:hypothetical protein
MEMNRSNIKTAIAFASAGLLACAAAWADGLTQIHPGYTMTDIMPAGGAFLVGGIDFFSNGDMAVCNWGNPGDAWIFKHPATGDKSSIPAKRFAAGLKEVLGCRVVNDTMYVMQMGELTQLVDKDGDGVADEYNKVNDNFSTSESLLAYAYDVEYLAGSFFAVLSSDVSQNGMDNSPALPGRSVFIRMGRDNSTEVLSSGFRNPNGMALGFGNRLFAVDNQGSWEPTSKINYLQKGKFFGHYNNATTPLQPATPSGADNAYTRPMVWMPRGSMDYQPGGITFIKNGIFKNQLFFAEPDNRLPGRIYRIYMEQVGDQMQGGVVPFSGGLSGVMRVNVGPGDVLYAGNLSSKGTWGHIILKDGGSDMGPGLKRLVPKDINKSWAFEILAVHSAGPTKLHVEFTEPVATVSAANFSVETWTHKPVLAYGGGNEQDKHALTVQSATVMPDGKTVEVTIAGLKTDYSVHITLNGVKSTTGESPWGSQTWFTLNAFGPGQTPAVAACSDPNQYTGTSYAPDCNTTSVGGISKVAAAQSLKSLGAGRVSLELPSQQAYNLHLYDVRGVERANWQGNGPAEIDAFVTGAAALPRGLYFMRLQAGEFTGSLKLLRP